MKTELINIETIAFISGNKLSAFKLNDIFEMDGITFYQEMKRLAEYDTIIKRYLELISEFGLRGAYDMLDNTRNFLMKHIVGSYNIHLLANLPINFSRKNN